MSYKCKYFSIKELCHPQILEKIGEANAWARLDQHVLKELDAIRIAWGKPIFINRLNFGIDSRGLRPPDDPDGSFYSVHKQGKAFDLEDSEGDNEGLYKFVLGLIERGALVHINTLEDVSFTPSWVHVASMNVDNIPNIIKP